ncbi:MAG: hypothetical protein RID09_10030 [Coleofasciculus sp. G1-WW12-02]
MTKDQSRLNYTQFPWFVNSLSNYAQQSGVSHRLARRSRATD